MTYNNGWYVSSGSFMQMGVWTEIYVHENGKWFLYDDDSGEEIKENELPKDLWPVR